MKTIAKILLWFGYSVMVLDFGAYAGRRNAGGYFITRMTRTSEACEQRQKVLMPLDGASLTAAQHDALLSMCDRPDFPPFESAGVRPEFFLVTLLAGLILYLVASARESRQARSIQDQSATAAR